MASIPFTQRTSIIVTYCCRTGSRPVEQTLESGLTPLILVVLAAAFVRLLDAASLLQVNLIQLIAAFKLIRMTDPDTVAQQAGYATDNTSTAVVRDPSTSSSCHIDVWCHDLPLGVLHRCDLAHMGVL
jgi:hypothetical protein